MVLTGHTVRHGMMRTRLQRYAMILLTVFTVGGIALPFAHELTHIRSLEHRHGPSQADLSQIAAGPGGIQALDFLVEERTVPHNPNCDLCARLTLDTPRPSDPVVPFRYVDDKLFPHDAVHSTRAPASRQIRAPPVMS